MAPDSSALFISGVHPSWQHYDGHKVSDHRDVLCKACFVWTAAMTNAGNCISTADLWTVLLQLA